MEFFLWKGKFESVNSSNIIRIPLASLEGVSRIATQVQLKHEDEVIIIRTYLLDRITMDQATSGDLFQLLLSKEVTEYAMTEDYGIRPKTKYIIPL